MMKICYLKTYNTVKVFILEYFFFKKNAMYLIFSMAYLTKLGFAAWREQQLNAPAKKSGSLVSLSSCQIIDL